MKRSLRQLLIAADLDGDLTRDMPHDGILILENYGAIPPAVRKSGYYVWNRGFNILLLGRDDVPRYFCKCRPIADANLARETSVLLTLNRDPELRPVVPRTSGARDEEVQLQLSEFMSGEPYERTLPGLTQQAWLESMGQILGVARMVSARATKLLPDLVTAPARRRGCPHAARGCRRRRGRAGGARSGAGLRRLRAATAAARRFVARQRPLAPRVVAALGLRDIRDRANSPVRRVPLRAQLLDPAGAPGRRYDLLGCALGLGRSGRGTVPPRDSR